MNPFAPPRSDTTLIPAPPSRRIGWKVYALAVAAVQLVGLLFALPKMGIAEALDYVVTTVALTGLFAYAFRRPLVGPFFGRRIWMVLSLCIPVWDVVMGPHVDRRHWRFGWRLLLRGKGPGPVLAFAHPAQQVRRRRHDVPLRRRWAGLWYLRWRSERGTATGVLLFS